jgi:acetolactate synthase-1/3 small subunit
MNMENECNRYSVIIYTENQIGLLSQFSNIFSRRGLSIWSLLALPTDIKGIHYLTIVTDGNEKTVHNAVLNIEKMIDVVKAYYYPGDLIEHPDRKIYKLSEKKVKEFIHDRTVEKENFLNNK